MLIVRFLCPLQEDRNAVWKSLLANEIWEAGMKVLPVICQFDMKAHTTMRRRGQQTERSAGLIRRTVAPPPNEQTWRCLCPR
jgi:hypothetical protein